MQVAVIEVPGPGGSPVRHYLTLLKPDTVFKRGLPEEAVIGELTAGPTLIDAEHLIPNDVFARFVNWVIAKHAMGNARMIAEAQQVGTGTVVVADLRVSVSDGALAPEDIVGAFDVKGGRLVRYHGSPGHLPWTARGLMQLAPFFEARLLDELHALRAVK